MEKKYTPGNWRVNAHGISSEYSANISSDLGVVAGIMNIRTIAVILKHAPLAEQKANARLIAEAPNLLNSLEELISYIAPTVKSESYLSQGVLSALQRARDAVLKATGGNDAAS